LIDCQAGKRSVVGQ